MIKILKPQSITLTIIILILLILNFSFIALTINQRSTLRNLEMELDQNIGNLNSTSTFLSNAGFIDWALSRKIISPIDLKGDFTSFVEMVERANQYLENAKTLVVIFIDEPKPISDEDLIKIEDLINNNIDYIESSEVTTNSQAKELYSYTDITDTERSILLDETYFLPASIDIVVSSNEEVLNFLEYTKTLEAMVKTELGIEIKIETQVPEIIGLFN